MTKMIWTVARTTVGGQVIYYRATVQRWTSNMQRAHRFATRESAYEVASNIAPDAYPQPVFAWLVQS